MADKPEFTNAEEEVEKPARAQSNAISNKSKFIDWIKNYYPLLGLALSLIAIFISVAHIYYNFFHVEEKLEVLFLRARSGFTGKHVDYIDEAAYTSPIRNTVFSNKLYAELAFSNTGTSDIIVSNLVVWLEDESGDSSKYYLLHDDLVPQHYYKPFDSITIPSGSVYLLRLDSLRPINIGYAFQRTENELIDYSVHWQFTTIGPVKGMQVFDINWGRIVYWEGGSSNWLFPPHTSACGDMIEIE